MWKINYNNCQNQQKAEFYFPKKDCLKSPKNDKKNPPPGGGGFIVCFFAQNILTKT